MLDSDTNVELVDEWLTRTPFDAVALSLPEPLSLHDGNSLCHYTGCVAAGISSRALLGSGYKTTAPAWTTYGPLAEGDGVRFLWLYTKDGDPGAAGQTLTVLTWDRRREPSGTRSFLGSLRLPGTAGRHEAQQHPNGGCSCTEAPAVS